jgi:hypothetical protein
VEKENRKEWRRKTESGEKIGREREKAREKGEKRKGEKLKGIAGQESLRSNLSDLDIIPLLIFLPKGKRFFRKNSLLFYKREELVLL